MTKTGYCCGQVPKRKIIAETNLPANPEVNGGIEMIYLGSGEKKVEGNGSGLTYHVSDHRRGFTAHSGDVAGILKLNGFIQKP